MLDLLETTESPKNGSNRDYKSINILGILIKLVLLYANRIYMIGPGRLQTLPRMRYMNT